MAQLSKKGGDENIFGESLWDFMILAILSLNEQDQNFKEDTMYFKKLAVFTALAAMVCLPQALWAGGYITGDLHNHTAFTDGATSIDRLVDESMSYGLGWYVQSGHGGAWSRDGRYDDWNYDCGADGEGENWEDSGATIKGDPAGTGYCGKLNMWRWQSLQEFAYPTTNAKYMEYGKPIIQGYEYQVPGHEHCSHGNIAGQFGANNADALAQFEYLFDARDNDTSEGDGQGWTGKIPNIGDGPGAGNIMHEKAVKSVEWLEYNYEDTSYVIWAHIERRGEHNPNDAYGSGYNVEHFRDFNNAGPHVSFGWEGEPGHQASSNRGGFGSGAFGGTRGGVGYYSATIGNMWDALLAENRNWWYFASSDWHNRGRYLPDDFKSTNDFWPGEFQKNYIYVENSENPTPQDIIDALRSGNGYVVQGDLIEELKFTAQAKNEKATMGQTLVVKPGQQVKIKIKVRDPQGSNNCPYIFDNPSLAQPEVGISQPINEPVLDHIDLIAGSVTGKVEKYLNGNGELNPAYSEINSDAEVIARFERNGGPDKNGYMTYVYQFKAEKSMYFRLRGTNMPVGTPNETDEDGNPLLDSMADNIFCDSALAETCVKYNDDGSITANVLNHDVEAWSDLWFMSNPIFVIVE
jgi:hypothetical protein